MKLTVTFEDEHVKHHRSFESDSCRELILSGYDMLYHLLRACPWRAVGLGRVVGYFATKTWRDGVLVKDKPDGGIPEFVRESRGHYALTGR